MNTDPVTDGDLRGQLEQARDVLWDRLSTHGLRADAVAPIAKAYVDVCVKLNDLPNDAEGSVTDDLSSRRAQRRAAVRGDEATGS